MSEGSSKPVVTKAGNKPVEQPIEKKGLFSRSKARKKQKTSNRAVKAEEKKRQKAKEQALAAQAARVSKSANKQKAEKSPKKKPMDRKKTKDLSNTSEAKQTKKSQRNSSKKRRRSLRIYKPSRKAQIFAGLGVLMIVVVGYGATRVKIDQGNVSSDSTQSDLLGDTTVVVTNSDFETVGSATSSDYISRYDPELGFYSFKDEVAGKLITVNQQPVPPGVKLTADVLLQHNDWTSVGKFDTGKGPVYIARVDDNPTHAVAFEHKDLWIFIRTDFDISTEQWVDYINSLN